MRVLLITLGDPGKLTGGYLYHLRLAALAAEHDATLEFASFPERPFPLPALHGGSVIKRAAGADVVAVDSIAAAYVAPWLGRYRGLPPVAAILHQPPGGIDHGPIRTFVQSRLDKLAYRRSARLLAASEALAQGLRDAGFRRDAIAVVAPGRDVAPTVAPPQEDLRRDRRTALLCVGNWVERKGILTLLDAVALLPEELATLHLVGDDSVDPSYAVRVRERVARPDLAARVVVHGPMPGDRVAGMYQAADVFVLPSTREPYGTVFGEAMASGLPVVGVAAGNLPHLATGGSEGLIVPVGDVRALAGALRTLCESDELRATMGAAARRRAQAFPTWSETASRFFSLMREVAVG